jgi:CheY-like chemotaxis protein
MRMPAMDGVQLLSAVRQGWPHTMRMMLTGNADQTTAKQAVNQGSVYRFLTKPCAPEVLAEAIEAGLAEYRAAAVERELLEQTLHGAIKLLTDVLSLANPAAFGRACRVQRLVAQLAGALGLEPAWELDVAAMLSQLGCVAVPAPLLAKVYAGEALSGAEQQQYAGHAQLAAELMAGIPRLEGVTAIILDQGRDFADGGEAIPLGARILRVALDLDLLQGLGHGAGAALSGLRARADAYDPAVLDVVPTVLGQGAGYDAVMLPVAELAWGMILADDVRSPSGVLLVTKGQEVSASMSARLQAFAKLGQVVEPVAVLMPKVPVEA